MVSIACTALVSVSGNSQSQCIREILKDSLSSSEEGSLFIFLFPNTHDPLDEFAHILPSCQMKGIGRDSTCQAMRVLLLLHPGYQVPVNLKPAHLGVQRRRREDLLQEVPCAYLAKVTASDSLTTTSKKQLTITLP